RAGRHRHLLARPPRSLELGEPGALRPLDRTAGLPRRALGLSRDRRPLRMPRDHDDPAGPERGGRGRAMNGLAILVATHPLATFLALCVLLLILAAGAWTLVQRLRRPLWNWSARAWERLGASPAARHLGWLSPPSTRAVR